MECQYYIALRFYSNDHVGWSVCIVKRKLWGKFRNNDETVRTCKLNYRTYNVSTSLMILYSKNRIYISYITIALITK